MSQASQSGGYRIVRPPWARQRVSRRRALQLGGTGALAYTALAIVGCGDDDEEEVPTAAATPAAETPAAEPAEAGDLIVAQAALMVTLDQEFSIEHETQESQVNCNAKLLRQRYIPDPFGSDWDRQDLSATAESFEGELAESFTVSDDGLTYTFKIRRGVVSPAGNEFTADDVVYNWQRVASVKAVRAFNMDLALAMPDLDANRVQKVDDDHVSFRLAYPFETFLTGIANPHAGAIIDAKLLQAQATEDDPWALQFAAKNSHGFGAYSLESFEEGKEAIFKANPNWVHGAPNIGRLNWRLIPDSSSRLALVTRGDAHIAKQMLVREQVEAEGGEGVQVPRLKTNYIVFGPLRAAQTPQFNDPRVRQAFLYTIPYGDIVNTVYQGRATRAYGVVWDLVPGYAGEKHYGKFTTDIGKARDLLAEAGLPDGFTFDLGYSLATPDMEECAVLMRDSAAAAGFQINLQGLTPSALNDIHNTKGGTIPHLVRDFSAYQTAIFDLGLFSRPSSPIDWAGWATDGADNFAQFQAALDRGIAVGDDDAPEALAAWDDAQKWYAEDAPYFWSHYVEPATIFRDTISGYTHRTDNTLDYGRMRITA